MLVEPNVALIPRLKEKRPDDIVLNVGIGLTDQAEADYFCYSDPSWTRSARRRPSAGLPPAGSGMRGL